MTQVAPAVLGEQLLKRLRVARHYITRPAIANERLSINKNGDVVLRLKSPYCDGTTHIVMSPLGERQPKIQ